MLIKIILAIILFILIFAFIYIFLLKNKINKEEIKYQIEEFKKSRALMGTLALVIALILCFIITPAFTVALKERVYVYEATKDIKAGELITDQMIREVEIGGYNISNNIIRNKNELKSKYAITQILKGQYFYKSAISENLPYENEYLYTNLTGANRAISFTVKNLSYGLSNKIIKDDIISLIVIDLQTKIEEEQAIIPEELRYIEVLSTTNNDGKDISELDNKNDDNYIYQTITALVSDEQALLIAKAEATKQIYVELVYRGNKRITSYLLNKQREILNVIYPDRLNDNTAKEINNLLIEQPKIKEEIKTEEESNIFATVSINVDELKNNLDIVETEANEENIESEESETFIEETTETTRIIETQPRNIETNETTKSIEQIQKEEYERIASEYGIK